jgi:hypothetical protein
LLGLSSAICWNNLPAESLGDFIKNGTFGGSCILIQCKYNKNKNKSIVILRQSPAYGTRL